MGQSSSALVAYCLVLSYTKNQHNEPNEVRTRYVGRQRHGCSSTRTRSWTRSRPSLGCCPSCSRLRRSCRCPSCSRLRRNRRCPSCRSCRCSSCCCCPSCRCCPSKHPSSSHQCPSSIHHLPCLWTRRCFRTPTTTSSNQEDRIRNPPIHRCL